jgi:hypothetical protein
MRAGVCVCGRMHICMWAGVMPSALCYYMHVHDLETGAGVAGGEDGQREPQVESYF